MALPRLEDIEGAFLDAPSMAILGDSIQYAPVGGSLTPTSGYVDYRDAVRSIDNGQVIEQDITVEVLRADVPVRPSVGCRVTLPKIPGFTFRPINVRQDASGNHWLFELERVSG